MKIIKKDLKKREIVLKIEFLDDLWTLSKLIDPKDLVSGLTERKIKIGDAATDRNVKVVRKTVPLTIACEKHEYEPQTKILRVTGQIVHAPDDIPKGEYHSFTITIGTQITLIKEEWLHIHSQRLQESLQQSHTILCCFHDRQKALIGTLSKQGFEKKSEMILQEEKKTSFEQTTQEKETIILTITQYMTSLQPTLFILGSPDFFKDLLFTKLPKYIQEKTKRITISDVSENTIFEVLNNPQFQSIKEVEAMGNQQKILQQILKEISISGKAEYGFSQIQTASQMGAIEQCLIANEYIQQSKEENTFDSLKKILTFIENQNGNIHIIDEESPLHETIMGLGGICALLRYSLE